MLRSMKEFIGYELQNKDKAKGTVADFLFDDQSWKIKHIEADLGQFLPGQKVLLKPHHLMQPEEESAQLKTRMSSQDLMNRPALKTDKPVSQQWENRISEIKTEDGGVGNEVYWLGKPFPTHYDLEELKARAEEYDYHLRSFSEIKGYSVQSLDDDFGRIEDMIIDTETWEIKSIIVSTRTWVTGKQVMISPRKIVELDWVNQRVRIPMTKNEIMEQKTFYPKQPVNPGAEASMSFDYYGRRQDRPDPHRLAL